MPSGSSLMCTHYIFIYLLMHAQIHNIYYTHTHKNLPILDTRIQTALRHHTGGTQNTQDKKAFT